MIHPLQRTNVEAIQDDLALELPPILLDVVVLDHDDDHVHFVEEPVEVEDLVLHDLLVSEEGVEGLERTGEVASIAETHYVDHIRFIRNKTTRCNPSTKRQMPPIVFGQPHRIDLD